MDRLPDGVELSLLKHAADNDTFTYDELMELVKPDTNPNPSPKDKAMYLTWINYIMSTLTNIYYCHLTKCFRKTCPKTYYLGDLCFILDKEQQAELNISSVSNATVEDCREATLDGHKVHILLTEFGQAGTFALKKGKEHIGIIESQSGTIGLCPHSVSYAFLGIICGKLVYVEDLAEWSIKYDNGILRFGEFSIDTRG